MKIETQHGVESKKTFHINKDRILIGRGTKCDIQISDPGLSREHALIELKDGNLLITDLDSTNGVHIDGKRIAPNAPTPYQTFFSLLIGETNVEINLASDEGYSYDPSEISGPSMMSSSSHGTTTRALPSPRTKKKQQRATVFIIVAIMAFGVSYFLNLQPEVAPVSAPAPIEEKKVVNKIQFEQKENYLEKFKVGGCKTSEEKSICTKLKEKWFKNEHISIGENIYVFINLKEEMAFRGYPKDVHDKFTRVLLASFATHPAFRELNQTVFVIGTEEEQEGVKIKYLVSVDRVNLPPLNDKVHRSIFSRALIGEAWMFDKIVASYLSIQTF